MSAKIESRFSPSVVKAAQMVEYIVALSKVSTDSALAAKAHDSFVRTCEDYRRITRGIFGTQKVNGYEVEDCMKEMQAERKRKAQMRREAQQRREMERQAALALIAA